MSKRQFEKIENRIREAAEQASTPFNEQDWEAMNLLLDKEFPEKRRRRLLLFWLWPLMGISVAGMLLFYTYNEDNNVAQTTQRQAGTLPGQNNDIHMMSEVMQKPGTIQSGIKQGVSINNRGSISNQSDITGYQNRQSYPDFSLRKHTPGFNLRTNTDGSVRQVPELEGDLNSSVAGGSTDINGSIDINDDQAFKEPGISLAIITEDTIQKSILPVTTDTISVLKEMESNDKIKRVKTRGFYFIAAGSLANSRTGVVPKGSVSVEYGIGIGYRLNKKWSLQTGFFAGRKKYHADKNQYSFKPGTYFATADVRNIDADCYVFDIPVSVRYDLFQNRKYNIYAVAGVSSYIMKKEAYIFSYVRNGMPNYGERTFNNNSHLLAVAGISAGYERKINHRFSVIAESYFKMPLSGVGEGKVRLHSTGILLGLKYNLPANK